MNTDCLACEHHAAVRVRRNGELLRDHWYRAQRGEPDGVSFWLGCGAIPRPDSECPKLRESQGNESASGS